MLHLSAYGKVRKRAEQAARCRRRQKAESQSRTPECGGNGFLNHRFHPVMERQPALQNRKAIEQSFFNSLDNLANLYGFIPPDTKGLVYPYNILLAFRYAVRKMEQLNPALKLVIIQNDSKAASIATLKIYDTGTTLYYIPEHPLYRLVNNKDRRAPLLLSVYAYFLQVAKVPYYRNNDSFLGSCCEVIKEWIMDDPGNWSREELKEIMEGLALQENSGNRMLKKISSPVHLLQFFKRIRQFNAETNADRQLKQLAERVFNLMIQYPGRTIYDTIYPGFINTEEEERVIPEHYISFMWEDGGWLYDELLQYVNTSLQEYGSIDEPLAIQFFDVPQSKQTHDLHFEETFFSLIDELVNVLNHVP